MKYLLALLLICTATGFAEQSCPRASYEMAFQMESDLNNVEHLIRKQIAKTKKSLNDLRKNLATHQSVFEEESFFDIGDDGNYTHYLQRKIKNKEQQIQDLSDLLTGMQQIRERLAKE